MNSRRTLIIVAALILAALAFLGNVLYLKGAQDRANKNAQTVQVSVVKKAIPKGLTGDQALSQEYIRAGEIPLEFRPGSAITDPNDIKNKVAITDLSPGQVLVDGQFVNPNVAQVTFAQRVPAGQVALSVSVDQVHGVAGLLVPGDKVNILVSTTDPADEKKKGLTVMYQNVNILAIGATAAPQVGDTTQTKSSTSAAGDSGLITFAVPLDAAQRIALAASGADSGSSIYLTLVPPDNTAADKPAPVTVQNVFDNLPLTPYPAS